MPKVFSRQEIFYLQNESSYGIVPNTSGTATLASSNACAMIQFKMNRITDTLLRRDKTGSRTATAGVAGRKIANWTSNMSLVGGATAGSAPDCDPILRSLFGAAPVLKTGTVAVLGATNATPIVITTGAAHGLSSYDFVSITGVGGNTAANGIWCVNVLTTTTFELIGSVGNAAYTSGGTVSKAAAVYIPTDAELSFSAWSFRTPSSAVQRVAFGCVAREGTFNLGEDISTWQAAGDAAWHADSKNFSNHTAFEKGGLTAFPADPGNPVTNGAGIAGFKGRAVLSGKTISRIRTAQIRYGSGLELPRDLFGSEYVDNPEADERAVNVNFSMYEDDSTDQAALEQAAITKSGLDLIFISGTVPGSAYGMALRGVQLASPDRDDSQRAFVMNYGDSRAYGSGITGFNEMRLWAL